MEQTEKRMAGTYEIIHAMHIGDREIVIGEWNEAPNGERVMCAICVQNEIFCGRKIAYICIIYSK